MTPAEIFLETFEILSVNPFGLTAEELAANAARAECCEACGQPFAPNTKEFA